jgi:hypothetical protein
MRRNKALKNDETTAIASALIFWQLAPDTDIATVET